MRSITIFGVLLILVLMSPVAAHSALFNNLKEDIQEELDANPFLKKQGIALKAIDTEGGYVTLEMQKGNRTVRERISNGDDVESTLWKNIDTDQKNTLNALRRTIGVIKSIDGVKAVLVESLINTPDDIAEDLEQKLSNAPAWVREVVTNKIYPGIGMAGIKLGDPIELVIKKFGKPSRDEINKTTFSDGRQEDIRGVSYKGHQNEYIGFGLNGAGIITSMYIGSFYRYDLPKINNTNAKIGAKYNSIENELGLLVSRFELLRDKESPYEYEAYNHKGVGLRVFKQHKNKEHIGKINFIIVPEYTSSSHFTFKEIK